MTIAFAGVESCQGQISTFIRKVGVDVVCNKTGFSPDTVLNWVKLKAWPQLRHYLILENVFGKAFTEFVKAQWQEKEKVSLEVRLARMQADFNALNEAIKHELPSFLRSASLSDPVPAPVVNETFIAPVRAAAPLGAAVVRGVATLVIALGLFAGLSTAISHDEDDRVRVRTARITMIVRTKAEVV